jgi:hypothetical protein
MVLRPEGTLNPQLTCNLADVSRAFGVRIAGLFTLGRSAGRITLLFDGKMRAEVYGVHQHWAGWNCRRAAFAWDAHFCSQQTTEAGSNGDHAAKQ